jgi:hypothetical protein
MAHEITASKALNNQGKSMIDLMDSIVPACCSEGCDTEPDGHCEHGFESVLLSMGMI